MLKKVTALAFLSLFLLTPRIALSMQQEKRLNPEELETLMEHVFTNHVSKRGKLPNVLPILNGLLDTKATLLTAYEKLLEKLPPEEKAEVKDKLLKVANEAGKTFKGEVPALETDADSFHVYTFKRLCHDYDRQIEYCRKYFEEHPEVKFLQVNSFETLVFLLMSNFAKSFSEAREEKGVSEQRVLREIKTSEVVLKDRSHLVDFLYEVLDHKRILQLKDYGNSDAKLKNVAESLSKYLSN